MTMTIDDEALDFDPFAAGAIERVIGTTEAQREIWLADRLSPRASLAYNESVSLLMRGPLDLAALQAAVDQVLARHESLRATFSADGMQLFIDEPTPHELARRDLQGLSPDARQAALALARAEAVETRFDLERGPLFRAVLLHCEPQVHELLMTAHHIVCDGWSWGQIVEDLGRLYDQSAVDPLPQPDRYEDYVQWERIEATSPQMQEHTRFWVERFAGGEAPVLELPADRARPPMRTFESRRVDAMVDSALIQSVRKLGAASGASLFATLFGAFAGTMHRLTQQDDLVIGVAAAGQSASDMPTLVGHCVNVLPIRIAVDPSLGMQALVQQSSTTLLDAFEHQTLTYGALLQRLQLKRDPSRPTLVSVMFNLDRESVVAEGAFPGLAVEVVANPRHFENFELFLNCTPTAQGLRLECQYNTGLFDEVSVRRWLELFRTALARFAVQPTLAVTEAFALSETERTVLAGFNDTAIAFPHEQLLHAPFEQWAADSPDLPALRFDGQSVSYAELNRHANRIAHRLIALGLRPDARVGLCAERSVEMVAALLGILKAGAAYVPLDPGYPADRLAYMLGDSAPAVLLTQSQLAGKIPAGEATVLLLDDAAAWAGQPEHNPDAHALGLSASSLAYIIYTSGSTGLPKGVMNEHRGVVNRLTWAQRTYALGPGDKVLQKTPFSFDVSVWEFFWTLRVGAQLVVARPEGHKDPAYLTELLRSEGITTAHFVPSMLQAFLAQETLDILPALQRVLCSGEALPVPLVQRFHERLRGVELHNLYGPTEAAVDVTAWACQPGVYGRSIPIGRPVDNTRIHVLDAQLKPVPIGTPGEIHIGGVQVARGYLNRPELTAERFIADPFANEAGARLYKTGDLGRWQNDGSLEYLGRNDFQVKIRGFRIELGEVEARLGACAGVQDAVAVAREDTPGDTRLVAYVSARPSATLVVAQLRESLAAALPDYMVPTVFVVLPTLPLTTSGKVDRKALPAPDVQDMLGTAGPRVRVEPANELQRQVLAQMEQALSLPGLSMDDDFFAVGGHSLLAARLIAALIRALDLKLPLAMLFEAPTALRLSQAIERIQSGGAAAGLEKIAHRADQRSAPLTPMQDRIRFMEELHPGRSVYNVPSGHRLRGPLDLKALEAALREMIRRQPSLRTVMDIDAETGQPLQRVLDRLDIALPLEDLRGIPEGEREAALREHMQLLADAPMDIHRGPLFHLALYRLAEEEHALLFVPHHLVWDGWSFDVFQSDLAALYGAFSQGKPSPLPELALTHGDYASWYADWLAGPEAQKQLGYWKGRFAAVQPAVSPRTDMPRRAGMSGEGRSCHLHIDRELTERLRETARRHNVTLNMLTLGVLTLMMGSATGAQSIVIATPLRGRDAPELESVMGFFNNLVLLPFDLDGEQTLGEFLRGVKQELVGAMDHQQIPFEHLAHEPEFVRRAQGASLYQALFSFQDARERPLDIGTLRHEQIHLLQRGATDDMGLWLMDKAGELVGAITFNAELYLPETGESFRQRYMELLQKVAQMPDASLDAITEPGDSQAARLLSRLTPDPEADRAVQARPAPVDLLMPEQAMLAQVWASVLGIDVNDIHPTDNFFDLGGDSLLTMRAVQQAEQALGFRVEARRYLFESLAQLSSGAGAIAAHPLPTQGAEATPRGLLGRVMSALVRK
ncbi:non-ribosomal peptide synthetase [Variovorax sp. OV329]|uniref:non-ribosomal peptide synthetase n=1 Tax=Variovorax sp. OV329 TaxID=1882825 RepID=UPI0008E97E61|nr:non-ribosomal peptide synthetase [Variovorax sp. OV329]SFM76988.1 amino acid adenylation domain-containing protein [Variovorax sp. OV329]